MIAEFYRPTESPGDAAPPAPGAAPKPKPPPEIVGRATWDGRRAVIEAGSNDVEAALRRVFRPTAVQAEDPSIRQRGASGPSTIAPGTLEWFRWAALNRAGAEGLAVRLVAAGGPGGWDPAANYRTFREQVARLQG